MTQALNAILVWSRQIYGEVDTGNPEAWIPEQLEYQLQVTAGNPGGGVDTLRAEPDPDGQYHWSSFDQLSTNAGQTAPAPTVRTGTLVPQHLRFEGMPLPRYWAIESNEVPLTGVLPDTSDVPSLLVTDMGLIHGVGWYLFPLQQDVGTLTRIDTMVVHDVFGGSTLVERADATAGASGETRWTMYSHSKLDGSGKDIGVTNYLFLPPATGELATTGALLEQVYFARDEVANMAWGIERMTATPLGKPRSGNERNAAVKQAEPPPPPPDPNDTAPLRYSIESEIPVHWTPLLGIWEDENFVLEKAGVTRFKPDGNPALVTPNGRILNPTWATPRPVYQIRLEQVPRNGKFLERSFYYQRWIDGSSHLWVARRRKAGRGEAGSNLRFDRAIINQR